MKLGIGGVMLRLPAQFDPVVPRHLQNQAVKQDRLIRQVHLYVHLRVRVRRGQSLAHDHLVTAQPERTGQPQVIQIPGDEFQVGVDPAVDFHPRIFPRTVGNIHRVRGFRGLKQNLHGAGESFPPGPAIRPDRQAFHPGGELIVDANPNIDPSDLEQLEVQLQRNQWHPFRGFFRGGGFRCRFSQIQQRLNIPDAAGGNQFRRRMIQPHLMNKQPAAKQFRQIVIQHQRVHG